MLPHPITMRKRNISTLSGIPTSWRGLGRRLTGGSAGGVDHIMAALFAGAVGADAKKVKPISYGKERPVDPGHDESAWAKNRRVEISVEGGK